MATVNCTQCGANLGPEDLMGTNCRYCGTVLPHQTAAQQQHLLVQKVLSDPSAFAPMVAAYGGPVGYGAPVPGYGAPPGPYGAIPYGAPAMNVANASAMVGRSVERSLKMGLVVTFASIGATLLVTAIVMLAVFAR